MSKRYLLFFYIVCNLCMGAITGIRTSRADTLAVNLGIPPNSAYDEYLPTISADGKTIYFTSSRTDLIDRVGKEDVWYSVFNNGAWALPVNIGEPINTPGADGGVSLTSDEMTMYLASGRRGSIGNIDIFVSNKINGKWSEPKNLGSAVNTSGWDTQPCISADGKTLFFVSVRPGGLGGGDIWMATKTDSGWTKPVNLGSNVNSKSHEQSPFIHSDGKTLYFSSEKEGGCGGFDIYKTTIEKGVPGQATALEAPINTSGDDFCYTIPASGDKAYFSSSRKEGNLDIYSILLPQEAKPENKVIILSGRVTRRDTSEENDVMPVANAKVLVENLETGEKFMITTTDEYGKYKLALPAGTRYAVTFSADSFLFSSTNIDLNDRSSVGDLIAAGQLAPIKRGEKIDLRNVFFDFGKDILRPESRYELDRVVKIMKEHPSLFVEIAGHCDDIGSEQANLRLSQGRADAVKYYIASKGIATSNLTAKGYGKSQPLVSNIDEASRQQNRRVEFKIVKE